MSEVKIRPFFQHPYQRLFAIKCSLPPNLPNRNVCLCLKCNKHPCINEKNLLIAINTKSIFHAYVYSYSKEWGYLWTITIYLIPWFFLSQVSGHIVFRKREKNLINDYDIDCALYQTFVPLIILNSGTGTTIDMSVTVTTRCVTLEWTWLTLSSVLAGYAACVLMIFLTRSVAMSIYIEVIIAWNSPRNPE